MTTKLYKTALSLALDLMDFCPGLEPTSALKQAASDLGIDYGEPMRQFVEWAYQQPVFAGAQA